MVDRIPVPDRHIFQNVERPDFTILPDDDRSLENTGRIDGSSLSEYDVIFFFHIFIILLSKPVYESSKSGYDPR